jgi:hypothetical protein
MIVEAENNKVLDFLHGDYSVVIESVPIGITISENILHMEAYCKKLNWFVDLNFNTQRKFLLTFGDYAFPLSGNKFDYGQDKESWGDIFTNQSKFVFFKTFLNCNDSLDEFAIETTINIWQTNNTLINLNDDERYKYYLIKYDFDRNYFAWGWGVNDYTIRTHTVRKSGYNYSIDIINYAVTKPFTLEGNSIGWVDGSRDKSEIKIYKNEQLYISMYYQPNDWVSGNWILKNMLEASSTDYWKMNNLIKTSPHTIITNANDIVDFGKNILQHLIQNL